MIERDVDHLVVGEFLAEGFGAEFEVAVGTGQQVGLHPCSVGFERIDDGGVGLGELRFGGLVGGGVEGEGNIVLEEADDAVDLLERDLGEDAGRVLEVLAGFDEDLRNLLLALDGRAEAGVDGSEGALHQHKDGVGDAGGVVVGILLPVANDFEGEQVARMLLRRIW